MLLLVIILLKKTLTINIGYVMIIFRQHNINE